MNPRLLIRRLLLALVFAVVLYAFFVFFRGYQSIKGQLAVLGWSFFLIALGLSFSNYVLRFLKWEFYLARLGIRHIPKWDSFLTFLSGFVLTVTPGKVGEVLKSVVLHDLHGVPIERTAPIVIAERLTDVLGIVVLVLVGSLAFPGGLLWASAGGFLTLGGVAVLSSHRLMGKVFARMERSPGTLRTLTPRLVEGWHSLRLLLRPQVLWVPTVLSVASWSLEALALWALLRGLGTSASGALALFVYSTSTLAGALLPLPGGLGITEGSLEQQLVHLGHIPTAAATTAMILVRITTLWFAVLLGFASLAILRRNHPNLLASNNQHTSPLPDSHANNNTNSGVTFSAIAATKGRAL